MKTLIYAKNIEWLLIVLFLVGAATVQAAPGDLDTTFNGTGKMRVGVGGGDDYGNAVARQSDGKLIVAGQSDDSSGISFSLVRYNTNGTLDAAFGTGGKVLTMIGGGATALTILSDGKILAAGSVVNGSTFDFALVKYNSNGTLDTTFGIGGTVRTDFNNSIDEASAMAVQPDGKIVLAGQSGGGGALARYNTNGSLDTTFDGDGRATDGNSGSTNDISSFSGVIIFNNKVYVTGNYRSSFPTSDTGFVESYNANGSPNTAFPTNYLPSGSSDSSAASLVVLATVAGEEKIIVAGNTIVTVGGTSTTTQALWSLDINNGSLDTGFSGDGRTTLGVSGTTGNAVRILTSNTTPSRIIVAGRISTGTLTNDFMIARYQLNGALDTAFDGDGIATVDADSRDDGRALLIQSDNKIVVAGYSFRATQNGNTVISSDLDFGIVRFNANGSLDTTFSGDGKRLDDVSNAFQEAAATLIQTDGKIIAAGNSVIARFNSDGTFDTTFDEDGKTKIPLGDITGAAIQPDGKIVLAAVDSSRLNFLAYRLNADGSLDNKFDGDGMAFAAFGNLSASPTAIAIQPDGAIVLAGYINVNPTNIGPGSTPNYDFAVARFLPTGALDPSFDSDGKVTTPIGAGNDKGNALVIQPNGAIVVAGFVNNGSNNDFGLVRYKSDGSLDTAFGVGGKLTTPIGTSTDIANAVALQTDGKIVVAGYAYNGSNNNDDFAAARYNTDGSPDSTFDVDGKLTTSIGTLNDVGNAVAIQSDGKILIAGSTENASFNLDFAVARYNSDGSLVSAYGSGGKAVVDVSGGDDFAYALALDSSGRAVVVGAANGLFGVVRLLGSLAPTAASVSVSGRVLTPAGRGLTNAIVVLTDSSGSTRTARTSVLGYYRFDEVEAGQTYILAVSSKRYQFNPQVVTLTENLEELDFVGE